MEWKQVAKLAAQYPTMTVEEREPLADFGNVIFLTEAERIPTATTLYIGSSKDLSLLLKQEKKTEAQQHFSFIAYRSFDDSEDLIHDPLVSNIIILAGEAHLHSFYNDVLKLLDRERSIEFDFRQFIILMRSNPTLDDMAQQISTMFYNYPVFIVSNTFSILAHSEGFARYKDLEDDLKRGAIEIDVLPKRNDMYSLNSNLAPATTVIGNQNIPFKNYHTAITNNLIILGYLDIFIDKNASLSELEISYLGFMADLISHYFLETDLLNASNSSRLDQLFSSLLFGKAANEGELENRMLGFGYNLRKKKRILTVRSSNNALEKKDLRTLGTSLLSVVDNSIFIVENNAIIFLQSYSDEFHVIGKKLRALDKSLFVNNLTAGISTEFQDLEAVPNKLLEAESAIESGRLYQPDYNVYFFERLRIQNCAKELISHAKNIDLLCSDLILMLLDYDRKNLADLTKTLYYYLHFPKNIPMICEELHIHKNTLYARLKKILAFSQANSLEELLSVENTSHIYLTLLLQKAQGKLYFDLAT